MWLDDFDSVRQATWDRILKQDRRHEMAKFGRFRVLKNGTVWRDTGEYHDPGSADEEVLAPCEDESIADLAREVARRGKEQEKVVRALGEFVHANPHMIPEGKPKPRKMKLAHLEGPRLCSQRVWLYDVPDHPGHHVCAADWVAVCDDNNVFPENCPLVDAPS